MREAAVVGYLFKIDPVAVLSGSAFEFNIRRAAARYIDDLLEDARKKN